MSVIPPVSKNMSLPYFMGNHPIVKPVFSATDRSLIRSFDKNNSQGCCAERCRIKILIANSGISWEFSYNVAIYAAKFKLKPIHAQIRVAAN